ncbi:hypothetical protein [Burkholderia glumae]|uniref:hypothetical protein n=1 Tax=Burkholderia glumae TaxID=337 RepID=UPI0012FB70CF|nr:hypothetical protein [Burkholderia glumae]
MVNAPKARFESSESRMPCLPRPSESGGSGGIAANPEAAVKPDEARRALGSPTSESGASMGRGAPTRSSPSGERPRARLGNHRQFTSDILSLSYGIRDASRSDGIGALIEKNLLKPKKSRNRH